MRVVECRSPNFDARDRAVDMLVLHYTGMKTGAEALARLCDPAAKVSAHYTIDRDGRIYAHVPEEMRAWHAGISYWAGEKNVNGRSIGIEIVNPGHEFGYVPFADVQIAALIDLADGIVQRHKIPANRVLGHSDVAPARKQDPGELFPWKCLSEYELGVWPNGKPAALDEPFEKALSRFGYGVAPDVDVPLKDVIAAFQRHFRPSCVDGIADAETKTLLGALLAA
jgi:N-acetylmuramoyl-L-alanine amidase